MNFTYEINEKYEVIVGHVAAQDMPGWTTLFSWVKTEPSSSSIMNSLSLLSLETVAIEPEYVPVFTENKPPIESVLIGVG